MKFSGAKFFFLLNFILDRLSPETQRERERELSAAGVKWSEMLVLIDKLTRNLFTASIYTRLRMPGTVHLLIHTHNHSM